MAMVRRRWPIVVFLLWTAYVWTTRIVNAWTASDEAFTAKVVSTLVALALLVAVAGGVVILWRVRGGPLPDADRRFFALFAAATVLVWALRIPQILFDGARDVPFKVVHVVLGVISVALAALVWSRVRGGDGVDADRAPVSPAANARR